MTIERLEELAALEKIPTIEYLTRHAQELDIYYSGWECDEVAWKIDNTIFRTDHRKLYIEDKDDFLKYINNLEKYIIEAKKFLG